MSLDIASQPDRMDWSAHSSSGDSAVISSDDKPTPLSTLDGDAHVPSDTPMQASLADLYQRIEASSEDESLSGILGHSSFSTGSDCILHYASTKDNQSVLRRIIKFMHERQLSINTLDAKDSSALDAAIRASISQNVNILLREGAHTLVNRSNRSGRTPLHTAVLSLADPDIWVLLLQSGANPNKTIFVDSEFKTPLAFATDGDPYANSQYFTNIKILLENGASYDPKLPEGMIAYETFLNRVLDVLKRSSSSYRGTPQYLEDCLSMFLDKGSNPNCRLVDLRFEGGCAGHCRTFAEYVFFHAAHTDLADILIKKSDPNKFGKAMVESVLQPCKAWSKYAPARSPNSLLERLLHRGIKFGATSNPLCYALIKSPDEMKADFITTLLSTKSAGIHTFDAVYGRPLAALNQVRSPLRWQLAEMILHSDIESGPSPDGSEAHRLKIFIYDIHSSYMAYTEHPFRTAIASYLSFFTLDTSKESAKTVDECIRNVIHVLTAHILGESLPQTFTMRAAAEQRLQQAADMRRRYALPTITVNNDVDMLENDTKSHD